MSDKRADNGIIDDGIWEMSIRATITGRTTSGQCMEAKKRSVSNVGPIVIPQVLLMVGHSLG